ncbi:MAG: glycosyltransferase family 39 protein [Candidatus Competibacter sp.]|jgi:hypothetical protein
MEQKFYLRLTALSLLIFMIVIFARGFNSDSDPRGSLLVSQSIIKHGTVKLDAYQEKIFNRYGCVITNNADWYDCVIYRKNGHYYYYFPLGTSIISVPFIAVLNLVGLDILSYSSGISYEMYLQIIISAISSTLTFLFLFLLACLYLDSNKSLIISAITWFGTSFASTTATALWSHNFSTLFALSAIYFSIRSVKHQKYKSWPAIATSLFFSYLCRPTLILLAPFLIAYIFVFSKKTAFYISFLFVAFFMIFVGFNLREFGQILPDYYYPNRLSGGEQFFRAFYGNLLSPARGLVVFSPILMLVIVYFRKITLSLRQDKALLLILIWPIIHLIVISRFSHWWAGWSYGPRLMTDALPGIYLWLVLAVAKLDFYKPIQLGSVIVLGALSIYINTFQGLFNEYTQRWNAEPNIDLHPDYLFDWRYPQFLHNRERHEARLKEFSQRHPTGGLGG